MKLDILFVVCVLVSSHGLASAQAPTRDPIQLLIEYRHLIEAYRHGGVDEIARDLKRWDPRRFNETISLLATARKSDPFLLDTRVGRLELGGWNMPLVGAAVLLHADVFLQGAKIGARDREQLYFAGRLLNLYMGVEADLEFKRRATLTLGWIRQITGDFEALREQLLSARTEFASDPAMATAEGCLEEAAASPRASRQPFIREALGRAAAHYERALTLDPQFAEARVRLGYVRLRLGRADEARRELERAADEAREPRVAYLAWLFLGSVHEHADRLQDAIAAYRRALTTVPQCQVAAVALSHALYRVGDRVAAAAVAREAGTTDATACEDPWWSYDYGQAWKIEETMEALRRAVRP